MNMQNRRDMNFYILHPLDRWIRHAKLIEVHISHSTLQLLLAEIFNSPISAGTYHGQRVATSVFIVSSSFKTKRFTADLPTLYCPQHK